MRSHQLHTLVDEEQLDNILPHLTCSGVSRVVALSKGIWAFATQETTTDRPIFDVPFI